MGENSGGKIGKCPCTFRAATNNFDFSFCKCSLQEEVSRNRKRCHPV